MLDELMVATQHLIGWEEGAAELARLRRMADAYARERLFVDVHMYTGDFIYGCKECGRITDEDRKHTATCDVAIHLGLPREKGEGE